MAISRTKKQQAQKPTDIEIEPGAWNRFAGFVKKLAKAGPQHRPAAKPAKQKDKRA